MSQYDFGLGPVTAGNKSTADKNRSSVDGGCIDGFYVVRDEYHRTNSFTVIKVPEGTLHCLFLIILLYVRLKYSFLCNLSDRRVFLIFADAEVLI